MSHHDKGFYTASCNPPRRAKRPRPDSDEPDSASPPQVQKRDAASSSPILNLQPRPILPKRAASSVRSGGGNVPSASPLIQAVSSNEASALSAPIPVNPPSKRGRKPGPLSRSAREAQRRLNHSIIEKARRTKINNALATLKELVPLDYGKKTAKSDDEMDSDDDADDVDGEYGNDKKRQKSKPTGKKEEKEREYKLEILVRTVAFMQDLLERVKDLEQTNALCSNCTASLDAGCTQSNVKGFDPSNAAPLAHAHAHRTDRSSIATSSHVPKELTREILPLTPPQDSVHQSPPRKHSLPSISSWLPKTLLEPSLFHNRHEHTHNNNNMRDSVPPLQLPTPPSSTHFHPSTPSSTFVMNDSSRQQIHSPRLMRTPEEEHAASMLLQIRGGGLGSSPTFHPLPPSIMSLTTGPLSLIPPPLTSSSAGGGRPVYTQEQSNRITVQTPATILGLLTPPSI